MRFPLRVVTRIVPLVALVCLCLSCAESSTGPDHNGEPKFLSDYVNTGQLAGDFATSFKPTTGSAPAAGAGPAATVTATSAVSVSGGGGTTFNVSAASPFEKVFVTSAGRTGSLELDLPSPKTDQGVVISFNTLSPNPTLQFQVVAPGGAAGPLFPVVVSTATGSVAGLVASVTPDPIPFSGRTCTFTSDPNLGCVYQSTFSLQEMGGVAINVTQYTATWNFGGSATPTVFTSATLPGGSSVIPARESAPLPPLPLFVRCSTPTCSGSFFAATNGTMFISITGTDATGHQLNFRSPNITLLAAP